jgi:hypothetical protein
VIRLPRLAALPLLALLAASGCRKAPPPEGELRAGAVATVPGKVLVVRTTVPGERAITHLIGVSDGKVRLGYESDRWRLIDVPNRTVTFVDDIARTFRTVPLQTLVQQRRALLSAPLPAGIPRARIERLTDTRTFGGYTASGYVVTSGAYRREMWLSHRTIIAPEFLTLYIASMPLAEDYAGVMSTPLFELTRLQGFPVHERSEMTVRDRQMIIERTLVRVEERDVPAPWFEIPPDYRDLEPPPPTTPAAGRPNGASTPRGRKAPAAE